jgi:hypothetical protein
MRSARSVSARSRADPLLGKARQRRLRLPPPVEQAALPRLPRLVAEAEPDEHLDRGLRARSPQLAWWSARTL